MKWYVRLPENDQVATSEQVKTDERYHTSVVNHAIASQLYDLYLDECALKTWEDGCRLKQQAKIEAEAKIHEHEQAKAESWLRMRLLFPEELEDMYAERRRTALDTLYEAKKYEALAAEAVYRAAVMEDRKQKRALAAEAVPAAPKRTKRHSGAASEATGRPKAKAKCRPKATGVIALGSAELTSPTADGVDELVENSHGVPEDKKDKKAKKEKTDKKEKKEKKERTEGKTRKDKKAKKAKKDKTDGQTQCEQA